MLAAIPGTTAYVAAAACGVLCLVVAIQDAPIRNVVFWAGLAIFWLLAGWTIEWAGRS